MIVGRMMGRLPSVKGVWPAEWVEESSGREHFGEILDPQALPKFEKVFIVVEFVGNEAMQIRLWVIGRESEKYPAVLLARVEERVQKNWLALLDGLMERYRADGIYVVDPEVAFMLHLLNYKLVRYFDFVP